MDHPVFKRYKQYIHEKICVLRNDYVKKECNLILNNPLFQTCVGSETKHHTYPGGLLIHTGEVMEYAYLAAAPLHNVNYDVLIVSALFHDFGKTFDYVLNKITNVFEKTSHHEKVRHLSKSHAEFVRRLFGLGDEYFKTNVEHCILSHHGRNEWGSPVEPQTQEALLLHQADYLSSLFGNYKNGL